MLCDNMHLRQPASSLRRSHETTAGWLYDFTWSAPKSVSVLHAITGDQTIMEVFSASRLPTRCRRMEEDMQGARSPRQAGPLTAPQGNMCYAEFRQSGKSAVNGVPCPQLHAHVFTFNMSLIRSRAMEGRPVGKSKRSLLLASGSTGAVADGLQKLGYSIRKTKDAFEIEGVPSSALKKFSQRANLIDQVAQKPRHHESKEQGEARGNEPEKLRIVQYRTVTWLRFGTDSWISTSRMRFVPFPRRSGNRLEA